jgi:hypothetical protein
MRFRIQEGKDSKAFGSYADAFFFGEGDLRVAFSKTLGARLQGQSTFPTTYADPRGFGSSIFGHQVHVTRPASFEVVDLVVFSAN